ncbi:MAG: hypothetical protein WKG01_29610 [Kofleriaceae bacterium]
MQVVRFEGSLLSSLSELKAIEEQRIAEERTARAREIAERAASAEAAAQQQRDDVAAELAAERDATLAAARERYEAEREARIRVELAEAAERTRHQAQLLAQRQAEELALAREQVAKQRPTWMIAVTAVALVVTSVMVWLAISSVSGVRDRRCQTSRVRRRCPAAKQDAKTSREALLQLEANLAALDGKIARALALAEQANTKAEAEAAAKAVAELAGNKQPSAPRSRRRGTRTGCASDARGSKSTTGKSSSLC